MKLALIVGLLGLAACADNNIQGPNNVVHHGKHNSIKGKHNSVDGFQNDLKGKFNEVKGDKNAVHGNDNFVQGDDNWVFGSGNVVNSGKDIEVDSDIDEVLSAEEKPQWVNDLKEELQGSMDNMKETIEKEVKELTEGMRKRFAEKFEHKFTENMKKQFEDRFHSQSKLYNLKLQKLKKMKPGNHRL